LDINEVKGKEGHVGQYIMRNYVIYAVYITVRETNLRDTTGQTC
jgi:hypothetical protein